MELRINSGLSINDLARATHVSAGRIRDAEKGEPIGERLQFALASHFGQRPLDIFPLPTHRIAR